jgi:hypothetical protein
MASWARLAIGSALVLSALFMATTSSELGGLFARHQGHKIAQGYGMFLWAAVILYVATAWRVHVEGGDDPVPAGSVPVAPPPHFSRKRNPVPG